MIIQVEFAGNHEVQYDFFTDIPGLRAGDVVVCDTARGYSCGTVVGYVAASTKAIKWVVCQVPVTIHIARMRYLKQMEDLLS